jgi:hypothetical protein
MSPKGSNTGFWHKVPNIPDATVELRVYVPSYDDRVREEVMVSRRKVLQLHRCVSRNPVCEIINLLKVCVEYPVKKLHWTHAEDQARKQKDIEKVNFSLFWLSCNGASALAM